MRLHIYVVLLFLLIAPVYMTAYAGATDSGDRKSVMIMFFRPITQEDIKYLQSIGSSVKYTYSAINGVAVELPESALDRLVTMHQNPSAPVCDPVVKNISFIVHNGMTSPFDDNTTSSGETAAVTQTVPEINSTATACPARTVCELTPGSMFAFPVLPLAAHL